MSCRFHEIGSSRPRRLGILVVLVAAFLGGVAAPSRALDPSKAISQFNHRYWRDELPQATVHSIAQTRDGYLWLGTYEGLVRFDGITFTVFDSANTGDLPATTVFDLNEDPRGRLWIATNGGLTVLEDGVFTTHDTADGLPSNYVTVSRNGPDGSLWVGTDHGVCRLVEDGPDPRCLPLEVPPLTVRAMVVDAEGVVWVATDEGLGRYEEGRLWELMTTEDGLPNDRCRALLFDREGRLWVGTNGGLGVLEDEEFRTFTPADGLPDRLVRELLEDRSGNLWIGTEDSGLTRFVAGEPPTFENFDDSQGLSDSFVRSLFEDREGNLWVGTNGGLNQFRDGKMATFTEGEGLSSDFARSILEDRRGRLWVGTYHGGLNLFEDGRWRHFTTDDGLTNNSVLSLEEAKSGSLWIGTRNGLSRRDPDGSFQAYWRQDGLSNNVVRVLLEDREGALWVGTEGGGLDRFEDGVWESFSTSDGLANNDVRALLEDREGRLWVGTQGGLNRLDYGVFTRFGKADGLSNEQIFELHLDAEGWLWIGTDIGLNVYRDGRFQAFTTDNGLFDNKVFRILEDDLGFFWLSSNRGISRVARSELVALANGEKERIETRNFTKADGMKANQCNGASQPAGWRDAEGRIWFPTMQGVVRIDPHDLRINQLEPPVVIEAVVAGGEVFDPSQGMPFEPSLRRFQFEYTALSLIAPERVRFRYRLDGFDSEWQEAGARRTAFYTNLLPGQYTFRVVAANNDGIWNEEGATLSFVIRTPLWAQPWALLLYIVGLVALVWGGVRWRVRSLERQNRLLESAVAERTAELDEKSEALSEKVRQLQISERRAHASERQALEANRAKTVFLSNMSHELRTPLNSIIGFSSILESKLAEGLDSKYQRFLGNIRGSGEHLLGLINDLLDLSKIEAGRMEVVTEDLDVQAILDKVRALMRGVTEERRIEIRLEVPEDLPPTQTDVNKFQQILLNLVSNAVKFSPEDSLIVIRAEAVPAADSPLGEDSLSVHVVDQGIGISEEDQELVFEAFRQADGSSSRPYQGTGLGLALIKRLLEIQGGKVELESAIGEGSTFTIFLPRKPIPSQGARRTPALRSHVAPPAMEGEVRVLVVEDDPAAYHAIARTLEVEGFVVDSARDGKEALERIEENPPDLITLDLVLPGLDGWEVLKELKSQPGTQEIPIVIVSVRDGRELGLALGASDFFVKPVEPEGFLRRVREILEARARRVPRVGEIVVIDDERQAHELIAAILDPLELHLISCLDGRSGLAEVRRKRPDAIILDLMMPGMSGFEVAHELRADARTSDIPVVVLTAKELTNADREFLSGRITDLVAKGSDAHRRLPAVIRDLVGRV